MSKEKQIFKLKLLPLALLSCCAWSASALAGGYLPPRLSVDANAGGSATVGQADLLLSLKGDERRNLYLDPQAAYGTDEQWYADLGLGYRWIQNDAAILGGYVFASRSQVANQSSFWIANPGVEAMGSRWDARINGYIPVGGRSDDLGIVQFNRSSRFVFSGHTRRLVTSYLMGDETQQIGDGVDAKVGYQVFRNVPLKAYLGGYFFNIPNADNVRGGAAGVEYWFDQHVKTFINYTYDNLQHSTVVGGLAVSFGGVNESRADPSLSERLTDPVERYLANLGHGSGIPSDTELTNLQTGRRSVLSNQSINNLPGGDSSETETSSMAFFSQTGTPNNGGVGLSMANCNFENPCGPTDFSQTGVNTLNSLLPNTVMFFNGGTYPARNGSSALTLNNGQGVFGMNANYNAAASGAARPQFNGAFLLAGNNTLDSIILNNSLGAMTTAITSNDGQNLVINNVNIGSAATPYGMAMNLNGASAILSGSNVNTNANVTTPLLGGANPGILLSTFSSLIVRSSTINLVSSNASIEGISVLNAASLQFNDSQLNVTETLAGGGSSVTGIGAQNDSTVVINDSNITLSATVPPPGAIVAGSVIGLFATNLPVPSSITMNRGSLNITANGPVPTKSLGQGIVFNAVTCLINGIAC
jgi:hypothetical protein